MKRPLSRLAQRLIVYALVLTLINVPSASVAKSYSSGGSHSYSSSSHSSSGSSHSSSSSSRSSSSASSSRSSSSGSSSSHSSSSPTKSSSPSKSFSSGSKSYSSGSTSDSSSKRSYSSGKSYSAGSSSKSLAPKSSSEDAPSSVSRPPSSDFSFDTAAARARKVDESKASYSAYKDARTPPVIKTEPSAQPSASSGATTPRTVQPRTYSTGWGSSSRRYDYVPGMVVV